MRDFISQKKNFIWKTISMKNNANNMGYLKNKQQLNWTSIAVSSIEFFLSIGLLYIWGKSSKFGYCLNGPIIKYPPPQKSFIKLLNLYPPYPPTKIISPLHSWTRLLFLPPRTTYCFFSVFFFWMISQELKIQMLLGIYEKF